MSLLQSTLSSHTLEDGIGGVSFLCRHFSGFLQEAQLVVLHGQPPPTPSSFLWGWRECEHTGGCTADPELLTPASSPLRASHFPKESNTLTSSTKIPGFPSDSGSVLPPTISVKLGILDIPAYALAAEIPGPWAASWRAEAKGWTAGPHGLVSQEAGLSPEGSDELRTCPALPPHPSPVLEGADPTVAGEGCVGTPLLGRCATPCAVPQGFTGYLSKEDEKETPV